MAKPDMRRNPITGKWEPIPQKVTVDVIQGDPVPEARKPPAIAAVAEELAKMRQDYVALGTHRFGAKGERAIKAYRRKSLEFWHLTGKHPPPITADL